MMVSGGRVAAAPPASTCLGARAHEGGVGGQACMQVIPLHPNPKPGRMQPTLRAAPRHATHRQPGCSPRAVRRLPICSPHAFAMLFPPSAAFHCLLQAQAAAAPPAEQKKLWGGRFTGATDPLMEKFNESLPFDKRMWAEDIRVSTGPGGFDGWVQEALPLDKQAHVGRGHLGRCLARRGGW